MAAQETMLTSLDYQTLTEVSSGGWILDVKPAVRIASLASIQRAVLNPIDRFHIEDCMPEDYWDYSVARRLTNPEVTDAELMIAFIQRKIDKLQEVA